jgi:Zn-dependent metalloprotease
LVKKKMFAVGIASALLSSAGASFYDSPPSDIFSPVTIDGHSSFVSFREKSAIKWVVFPDQKKLHSEAVSGTIESLTTTLSSGDSFWGKVRSTIGLNKDCKMVMIKEWSAKASQTSYRKYSQTIKDIRVWGGEFIVASGAHGGVLHVYGQPLLLDDISDLKWEALTSKKDDLKKILEPISAHIFKLYSAHTTSGITLVTPLEKVIFNSLVTVSKQGESNLAYYINGQTHIDGTILSFDAFIDISTGKLLDFIDKSSEASPFESPIDDAQIYVYDQYLKDYNDDYIYDDDYYHPDPDRYSNVTLVFNSSLDTTIYPTSDQEMNDLIDNTLYIKYMYNSLSNGDYLTWNRTDRDWNIEYNLTLANAYFDGTWGIHFGSGYITDDVVPHEWSHGYTQTGCGLIYKFESGAMNEAFSDIFGETIDILNYDSSDPDHLRTVWPTSCHETLNSNDGIPPGNDPGTRWSMGENVTTTYPNKDGSLRDMYKPECFFQPSSTLADYYSCSTYYDGGGVHKNSGVLNRLYAVLVDGGEYANPVSTTGETLKIYGLGWTKASNLFWRTHEQLIPVSQYMDLAFNLNSQCAMNIGADLYEPNLLNSDITVSTEKLTQDDCDNVNLAIIGSGMASPQDFCSNIECVGNDYACSWKRCQDTSGQFYHEDYDYYMGYGKNGTIKAPCSGASNSFVRVFDQSSFETLNDALISCIQFGYFMNGKTTVDINVYIDKSGGAPDTASFRLLKSFSVDTINACGQFQVQTVSTDVPIEVDFQSKKETLVIEMKTQVMSEGSIKGGGQFNFTVKDTTQTYVGDCSGGYMSYASYVEDNPSIAGYNEYAQWYVRLHGTNGEPIEKNSSDDDDGLSSGAIAGISIGVIVGVIALGGIGYFVFAKKKGNLSSPLISDSKI